MLIIQIVPFENGGRPPMQSWGKSIAPSGYALVPDDLDTSVFYKHNGFVSLSIEDGAVVAMTPSVEAWEAWKALLPEHEAPPFDDITLAQLAIAELAEAQAAAQTENELALAELAELLVGGE